MKKSIKKQQNFLESILFQKIKSDLKSLKLERFNLEIDENDSLSVLFTYPAIYQDSYVVPRVKLEIGALAARIPIEEKLVTPYIEDYLKEAIHGFGFKVKVVSAVRTLFEKMTILHSEANRTTNHPVRYARHYYDTYMISNTKIFEEALSQIELLKDVVTFKIKFYRSPRSKYEEILEGNLKLAPNDAAIKVFKADYEQMNQMFFGDIPSFHKIINRLRNIEEIINQTVKKV